MISFIFLFTLSTGSEQVCRDLRIWNFKFLGQKNFFLSYFLFMSFFIFCWKVLFALACKKKTKKI